MLIPAYRFLHLLPQDMLLKRAADIAEALYSVPRPHSQLQALPSSPAHGSVMGLGSYPSQLGVSIGEPGQSSQGEQSHLTSGALPYPGRRLELIQLCFHIRPPPIGYIRNSSSLSPRGYPSASTPQQSGYGGSGGMTGGYGTVPMTSLGVPGSPGFNSASPTGSPYSKSILCCAIIFTFTTVSESAVTLTAPLSLSLSDSNALQPNHTRKLQLLLVSLAFLLLPICLETEECFCARPPASGLPLPGLSRLRGEQFQR